MTRTVQTPLLILAFAASLVGCGDVTTGTGDLGNVRYALHSDHLVDDPSLQEVTLIAGHPQHLSCSLTDQGDTEAGSSADQIVHSVTPEGATVENFGNEDGIGDLEVTVTVPGAYSIESHLGDELFDTIELNFDVPTELDLMTRVREPYADDWETLPETTSTIGEGAQVALLAIPVDSTGTRLAGHFDVEVIADPTWAVAPSWNVLGIYEQNIVGGSEPMSLYFVEPGLVSITITDLANGVSVTRDFDVLPVDAS